MESRGKSRLWFSRPGGGVILDGHPVPPREKGPSLPAMCRGQTQVEAGSGARVPLRSFSGEGGTTPRGARKKERNKTDNPREGWEDGTPPRGARGQVCGNERIFCPASHVSRYPRALRATMSTTLRRSGRRLAAAATATTDAPPPLLALARPVRPPTPPPARTPPPPPPPSRRSR